jgi:hypothetical protein
MAAGNNPVLRHLPQELETASGDELNFAWTATFHSDLPVHPHVLERWPEDGPHAFTGEIIKMAG